MREAVGEFEGGDEAGLLVQAAEVTDQIDNDILFLEGFIGQGVIEVVKGLLDLLGVLVAVQLVIGATEHSKNCVGIVAEVCLLFLYLQSS